MSAPALAPTAPQLHERIDVVAESQSRRTWYGEVSKSIPEHPAISSLFQSLREFGYTEHDMFAMRVALGEALANAYKHGNRRDPGKVITMSYELTLGHILVRVGDQGDGFDPDCVPDPRSPENLEEPNGRGLMMMRQFMTWVRFNATGNEVTLCLMRTD